MRRATSDLQCSDFERFGATMQLSEVQIRKAIEHIAEKTIKELPAALQSSFFPPTMQKQIMKFVQRQTQKLQVCPTA